ncbi:MAG TPA: response regulator transcription factor [Deltaproteobacteria bacterium]|nr:response regulator transcription factor [Deltaproteobacteria bacterium]HOM29125.1 response regulator transcription factor [Deltaproteobacteria bacterium]HPP79799.1 response regulator transcription factor [Deltaproteobacteria bacterium]
MIRVLVADDHPIVREGVKQILSETEDIIVSDEASTGKEALDLVLKNAYDVVILDISMPGRDGLETLKELKSARPKTPVLILSIYPEEHYAVRVLRAGAAGYVAKASAPDELIAAIRKVASGGRYLSPKAAERLTYELDRDFSKPLHEQLSDREHQVMRLMASGKSIKEIAAELCLSIKTVSTYRGRVFEKLGVSTNAALVLYALKNGLIDEGQIPPADTVDR